MASFNDYKLNFKDDRISDFIGNQLPAFVRDEGPDFVKFIEAYYKFLETKIVKMTITTTDANAINTITEGSDISSGHFISCENGVDPIVDITSIEHTPYRDYGSQFFKYDAEQISAVYDKGEEKLIVFYRNEITYKSEGVIISGNTIDNISISEPFVFCENFVQSIHTSYDKKSGKIIIAYNDVVNDLIGYLVTCEIVGNTLVYGDTIAFESGPTVNISITQHEANNKFVIVYSTVESEPKHRIVVGSITDSGVILGSDVEYKLGEIQYVSSIYDSNNEKIIVSYYDETIGCGSSIVFTINGYNVEYGKESVFNSREISHVTSIYDPSEDKVVILYQDIYNSFYGTASIGSVVGDEITFENTVVFNESETSSIGVSYDEDVEKIFISYLTITTTTDGIKSTYNGAKVLEYISADAMNESIYSSATTSSTSVVYHPIFKRIFVFYNDDAEKKGIFSIFSSYQFIYNIYYSGFGWRHGINIEFEVLGGSGSGAKATGIISTNGSLDYIIWEHGSGYASDVSNLPKLGDITGDEVHEVYLGAGTEDDPIIELEGYNSVVGKIIGQEDVDNINSGGKITRNIYMEHHSGDMSRAKVDDIFGELYNPDLLEAIDYNSSLPTINDIKELETPISAMNNLHNYSNIDYTFDSKLFIGNDIYSLMRKELMPNWPEFTYSIEKSMDAIITRNIKDVYKSIGTEDAIKFAFASIYGREVSVLIPSEKIYYLNAGIWDTINTISVNISQDRSIFNMSGRLIYNMSDIIIKNIVHDMDSTLIIETEGDHNLLSGYSVTILGDPLYNGKYKVTVLNDNSFTIDIKYSSVGYKQPGRYLEIAKQNAIVEVVTANDDNITANIRLSNISGTFSEGDIISGVLNNGFQFTNEVTKDLTSNEGYVSDKCLLNGSTQKPIPDIYKNYGDWGSTNTTSAALKLSDHINTDRMQDGDYYQLFSYVVKIKKENPPLLDLYTEEDITNTIIKLVHPGGFRLIIEEE